MLLLASLLGLNLTSFAFGCGPFIQHDQNRFCRSEFAFTGFVLQSTEREIESVFLIQLTSNLKGRIALPGQLLTIYGRGSANSCGPHRLNRLQGHIIYVGRSEFPDEAPRFEIHEHHDFNLVQLNSIANYDCSCEVEIDLPQQPLQGSTVPPGDKCVITENEYDCRFRQGYCSRRRSFLGGDRCRWTVPNTVCPRR
uniref:Uncharacterized protein n=1 Tax=Magallana gigas TaxID=29159 RepID=A0A8W8LJ17_MAGGI|nr:uncharacterized protein LOC105344926 [Crassostrea gigas]